MAFPHQQIGSGLISRTRILILLSLSLRPLFMWVAEGYREEGKVYERWR